jgi:phenylacetic acid degradation operon negative regulatory protein
MTTQAQTDIYQRQLSARSVIASMLLGTEPPALPSFALVRAGEFFGLAEGTVRTALSRMTTAGELLQVGAGRYQLTGDLLQRQRIQIASRAADMAVWTGEWEVWVVGQGARDSSDRAALRIAARRLKLAELREGVWLRPDNLDRGRFGDAREVLSAQATHMTALPDDDARLATELWDLEEWISAALVLRREMASWIGRLRDADTDALRPCFLLSATVLRHYNADPLLPRELLPRDWPGDRLRADYNEFDSAYRAVLTPWLRGEASTQDETRR